MLHRVGFSLLCGVVVSTVDSQSRDPEFESRFSCKPGLHISATQLLEQYADGMALLFQPDIRNCQAAPLY